MANNKTIDQMNNEELRNFTRNILLDNLEMETKIRILQDSIDTNNNIISEIKDEIEARLNDNMYFNGV